MKFTLSTIILAAACLSTSLAQPIAEAQPDLTPKSIEKRCAASNGWYYGDQSHYCSNACYYNPNNIQIPAGACSEAQGHGGGSNNGATTSTTTSTSSGGSGTQTYSDGEGDSTTLQGDGEHGCSSWKWKRGESCWRK